MNLPALKERVRAQVRQMAPLPHHNPSRTSTSLPPALSPTNRQRSATLLFTRVRRETVWKVLGGRNSSLRSAPWRAEVTPRICQTTSGVVSARTFLAPQDKDAPEFTACERS